MARSSRGATTPGAAKPVRRRDPEATRRKLLEAARHEFAKHGLNGATVDNIVSRAGVNKQLVYHYFGDKDSLYLAVLEWVYEDVLTYERELDLRGIPPEQAIRMLIESSFDHLSAHLDFIVLLNDENRNGAKHVRRSKKLADLHVPLFKSVSEILEDGVKSGVFRKSVDPLNLLISIAGLSYFYLSNTPTLSAVFAKDLASAASKRARRKHIVDFVVHALRP